MKRRLIIYGIALVPLCPLLDRPAPARPTRFFYSPSTGRAMAVVPGERPVGFSWTETEA